MITIGQLNCKCASLQGLKYGAINQNNYDSNIIANINNIQDQLDTYEYNRILKNDNCIKLKFKSLENPKSSYNLDSSIINIQSTLDSFDYNRTINNDINIALKFQSLENPKSSYTLNTDMYVFAPYKTYSHISNIIKKYNNMIKG